MRFDPTLLGALRDARSMVVFTGAGMSAESGVPTFRDAMTGLWERFDPTQLATAEAFAADPALVWGWYAWRRMRVSQAQPNAGHRAVAALAARRPGVRVVTQNVDDLHERAGNRDVLHLHGSLFAARCFDCGIAGPALGGSDEPEGGRRVDPPRCAACGGAMRPGVVWFGEPLPSDVLAEAFAAARDCDVLLCIGTSGVVHPAAQLPGLAAASGAVVAQVNPNAGALDGACRFNLRGTAAEVLPELLGP